MTDDDTDASSHRRPVPEVAPAIAFAVRTGNVFSFMNAVTETVLARFDGPVRAPETDETGAIGVPDPDDDREVIALMLAICMPATDAAKSRAISETMIDALETVELTAEGLTHLHATITMILHGITPGEGRCSDVVRRHQEHEPSPEARQHALPAPVDDAGIPAPTYTVATDDAALARMVKRYLAYCIAAGIAPTADEIRADREMAALPPSQFNAVLALARDPATPFIDPQVRPPLATAEELAAARRAAAPGPSPELTARLLRAIPAAVDAVIDTAEAAVTNPESDLNDSIAFVGMLASSTIRDLAASYGCREWMTEEIAEALAAAVLRALLQRLAGRAPETA